MAHWTHLETAHTDSASIDSYCLSHHGEEARAKDLELSERLGAELLASLEG
jgi:hypothetical protein